MLVFNIIVGSIFYISLVFVLSFILQDIGGLNKTIRLLISVLWPLSVFMFMLINGTLLLITKLKELHWYYIYTKKINKKKENEK